MASPTTVLARITVRPGAATADDRFAKMWHALVGTRSFWHCYLGGVLHRAPRTNPRCAVELVFRFGGFGLGFRIDTGEHAMFLDDGATAHQLGHVDAHFMSDVLRWDELEILGAALEPDPGPRWAIDLLLLPYVAIGPDIAERCVERLTSSLAASGAFTDAECATIVAARRGAIRDLRWQLDSDSGGWVAEGNATYSLRRRGTRFPFDRWSRLIAAAQP